MTTADMPLYPSEKQIALAVLGPDRAKDWKSVATYMEEKHGLPRVDPQMGGRFWPAVDAFFRQRHNLHLLSPSAGTASPRIKGMPYNGQKI